MCVCVRLCVPAALRLVHKSGGSDCSASDWAAVLLPTKGEFNMCVSATRMRGKQKESLLVSFFISLPSGSLGMHQRHQPQADVPSVSGLTGSVENQQD